MSKWALILGSSSGIGLATAHKLAAEGFNLLLVHRDRRSVMEAFDLERQKMVHSGAEVRSFNADAIAADKIDELIRQFSEVLLAGDISVVVHAISRGNLKTTNPDLGASLTEQDLLLTMEAMAFGFHTWIRKLHTSGLLASSARLIALTSSGSTRYWKGYAAVGMAKAALENLTQYMAVEYGSVGYTVNAIHAGITDTPSLQMIPGYDLLKTGATAKNPKGRMTQPADVANAIYLLTRPEAAWINGSIIRVDGGEHFMA